MVPFKRTAAAPDSAGGNLFFFFFKKIFFFFSDRRRSTVEQEQSHGARGSGRNSTIGRQVGHLGGGVLATGGDGYPKRIWDKRTGDIDKVCRDYWRDTTISCTHAARLGHARPKLRGKIRSLGLSDNFFLNHAVYLAEDFSEVANPPADARVDYGMKDEHC